MFVIQISFLFYFFIGTDCIYYTRMLVLFSWMYHTKSFRYRFLKKLKTEFWKSDLSIKKCVPSIVKMMQFILPAHQNTLIYCWFSISFPSFLFYFLWYFWKKERKKERKLAQINADRFSLFLLTCYLPLVGDTFGKIFFLSLTPPILISPSPRWHACHCSHDITGCCCCWRRQATPSLHTFLPSISMSPTQTQMHKQT